MDDLAAAHSDEALIKFEQLVEEAVDLDAVPEEYLIDANYDAKLKVCVLRAVPSACCCAVPSCHGCS